MMTSPAPPIDYRNAVTATGTDPAMKDHGLAAGQALMRLRVLRMLDARMARYERNTRSAVLLRELIAEIEAMEIT